MVKIAPTGMVIYIPIIPAEGGTGRKINSRSSPDRIILKMPTNGAEGMAQWLIAPTGLPENLGSVPGLFVFFLKIVSLSICNKGSLQLMCNAG